MPTKGETPGKGTYVCLDCGAEQVLRTDKEPLKGCHCGGIDFKKKEVAAAAPQKNDRYACCFPLVRH